MERVSDPETPAFGPDMVFYRLGVFYPDLTPPLVQQGMWEDLQIDF